MKTAILQVGTKRYRMRENTARALMTVIRGGPRFSYWVALSFFLVSVGLCLMVYLKLYGVRLDLNTLKESNGTSSLTRSFLDVAGKGSPMEGSMIESRYRKTKKSH